MIQKSVVVSGIRPTGFLHLGNYFGAIQNFVEMQEKYNCYFFIADLHSLTTHPNTQSLGSNVKRVVAEYLASGLNPEKCSIYTQSSLPQTSELYLYLTMLAYKGELEKTASFKEKIKLHHENINAGLLTYPVLMAADILIHQAQYVPVGKDQEQHLEMTRNFSQRFNHRYHCDLPEPVAFNFGKELIKIPSLDGIGKMSKSENVNATIYLSDDNDTILKKILKAKTDSGPTEKNSPMPDYIKNIFYLLNLLTNSATYEKYLNDYNNAEIKYGQLKKELAEGIISFVEPIREKTNYFLKNPEVLNQTLEAGRIKAVLSANATIEKVTKAMQLNYF